MLPTRVHMTYAATGFAAVGSLRPSSARRASTAIVRWKRETAAGARMAARDSIVPAGRAESVVDKSAESAPVLEIQSSEVK